MYIKRDASFSNESNVFQDSYLPFWVHFSSNINALLPEPFFLSYIEIKLKLGTYRLLSPRRGAHWKFFSIIPSLKKMSKGFIFKTSGTNELMKSFVFKYESKCTR